MPDLTIIDRLDLSARDRRAAISLAETLCYAAKAGIVKLERQQRVDDACEVVKASFAVLLELSDALHQELVRNGAGLRAGSPR